MKKTTLCLVLFLTTSTLFSQKYFTKTGVVSFEASVPSFEEVKAKNKTTTAILNIETGEIAALCLIKGFRFKVALMEEHFNENYAESGRFPKATFKGAIENFSFDELSDKAKIYTIKGDLSFHGKTVVINTDAKIAIINNEISLLTNFETSIDNFDIKLSKTVLKKVAETVDVSINFKLIPKK